MKTKKLLIIITSVLAFLLLSGFSEPTADPYALGCTHRSISPEYSEASHPHAKYVICNDCGITIYTGTYAVKNHGNGSWGSGTCPSCGSHSYVGRSCTNAGYCSCGASIAAYGHSLNGVTYSDATHPHNYYQTCLNCNKNIYIGGHATKNHGDGSWGSGTCPDCGSHTYRPGTASSTHPHEAKNYCDCGAYLTTYGIKTDSCNSCKQNTKTATNSASELSTWGFFDGDTGVAIVYTFTLQATTQYNNQYYSDSTSTNYHPFISLGSSVLASGTIVGVHPAVQPTIYCTASEEVTYYKSTGAVIATQLLEIINSNLDRGSVLNYTLNQKPSYCIASAGFGVQYPIKVPSDTVVEVTTTFP